MRVLASSFATRRFQKTPVSADISHPLGWGELRIGLPDIWAPRVQCRGIQGAKTWYRPSVATQDKVKKTRRSNPAKQGVEHGDPGVPGLDQLF